MSQDKFVKTRFDITAYVDGEEQRFESVFDGELNMRNADLMNAISCGILFMNDVSPGTRYDTAASHEFHPIKKTPAEMSKRPRVKFGTLREG